MARSLTNNQSSQKSGILRGDFLSESEKHKGAAQTLHGGRFNKPKLKEMGIDYSESHRSRCHNDFQETGGMAVRYE